MLKTIRELTAALAAIGHHDAQGLARFNRVVATIPPDVLRDLAEKQKAQSIFSTRSC